MMTLKNPLRFACTVTTAALTFGMLLGCLLALAPWQDARAETASKIPDYLLIEAIVPVAKDANWWAKRHDQKVRAARAGDIGMIMIGDSLVHNFEKRGGNSGIFTSGGTGHLTWDSMPTSQSTPCGDCKMVSSTAYHPGWRLL